MTPPFRYPAALLADLMGRPRPTPEQEAVIEAPLVPMLVVAGAGSGKTETMASRVVWLIANELVQPRQILGLTFSRKASHELAERIGSRLGALADALRAEGLDVPRGLVRGADDLIGQRPEVRTYNGFAQDLVAEHALSVGIDPDLSILSSSASWQLAHEIVESSGEELAIDASAATVTSALISLTSSLAEHLVDPADVAAHLREIRDHLTGIPLQGEGGRRRTVPREVLQTIAALDAREALIPLVERFAAVRHERGALDFADQVSLAARIAQEVPEAGSLARDLHRVVLLDEFQDTSVAQLELLAGLFGAGHPTIAVGDPQQAIYGWRGASSASLSGFLDRFETPATDEHPARPVLQRTLSTSWRNDQAILDVANRIAAPLREASRGVEIPELGGRPGAGEGAVEVTECADQESEARSIAEWIIRRRAQAAPGTAEDPPQPPTAAVLVRTRGQIPAIVQALDAAGVEAEVVGLGGLVHRPEVADTRALLEAAYDPGRGDALMRLLAGPRVRLGARDMAVLGRWRDELASRQRSAGQNGRSGQAMIDDADQLTLVDAVDDLPRDGWTDRDGRALSAEGHRRLREVQEMLRTIRRRLGLPLPDLVTAASSVLGMDLELLAAAEGTPGSALRDLEEFRRFAAEFERTALRPGLGAFLALLDVSEDKEAGLSVTQEAAEPDPQAVTVLTMHAAKGLEWDLVAVCGLTEGTVPSYRRASTAEDGTIRVKDAGWLGALADAAVPTSLRGDAETLPELRWAETDTQADMVGILEDFAVGLGAEKLAEDRRLMYVAVTRARTRLLLTSAAWRPGRKSTQPRSRYLSEVLPMIPEPFHSAEPIPEENPLAVSPPRAVWPPAPGPREAAREEAQRRFDAARSETSVGSADSGGSDRGASDLEEQVRRVVADLESRRGLIEVRSPARLSASQVVARAQNPDDAALALLRPLPRRPSSAARQGTEFHAWLEQRFGAGALLDLEDIRDLADLAALDAEATDAVAADGAEGDERDRVAQMRVAFDRSVWAERVPIAVEEPVTTMLGSVGVRGVIDAVYRDDAPGAPDGAVIIVDWKTGRRPTGAARRARAVQLSVYRLAWHERTGTPLEDIRTAFHYVAENVTDEVTEHPTRDELVRLVEGAGGPGD